MRDYSKKVIKILNNNDIYVIEYNLKSLMKKIKKKIKNCDNEKNLIKKNTNIFDKAIFILNNIALEKLSEYIEEYKKKIHIINTDFNKFMLKFLKKVNPESIDIHINCLSHLENIDLNYYRRFYSYSKIFKNFKNISTGIYTNKLKSCYIDLLIRLIDNSNLVFKNLSTIISKLIYYVKNDIIDRNMSMYFCVFNAVVKNCNEHFDDTIIISLISYFLKILYMPKNFLLFDQKETKEMIETIQVLCQFKFKTIKYKKHTFGMFQECIMKLNEYHNSTVHEEVIVLINMIEIVTFLFKLAIKQGNSNFEFLTISVFNFYICKDEKDININNSKIWQHSVQEKECKNKIKKINDEILKNYKEIGFEEKKSNENKKISNWFYDAIFNINEMTQNRIFLLEMKTLINYQNRFIEAKYIFLDLLYSYVPSTFNKNIFYEDLLRLSNPLKLFNNINNIKKEIDWSNMISYTLNSKFKESYLCLLFDDLFSKEINHIIYVRMFLKNIKNDFNLLIYFTKYAILKNYQKILPDIYFNNNSNIQIYKIILEYLNKLDDCELLIDDFLDIFNEFIIKNNNSENEFDNGKINNENFLSNIIDKNEFDNGKINKDEKINNNIINDDEIFNNNNLNDNNNLNIQINLKFILLLLLVIAEKLNKKNSLLKTYNLTRLYLEKTKEFNNLQIILINICVILLNKLNFNIFEIKNDLFNNYDIKIGFLNYVLIFKNDNEYFNKLKLKSFEYILEMKKDELTEIKMIIEKNNNSKYISTYNFIQNSKKYI